MAASPLVSIIMPGYNNETTIGAALSSALRQSYRRLEIVVVDDGSSDGTGRIAATYAALDDRIRLISQANAGTSAARNTALASCNGDLIALLDADDVLFDGHVNALVTTWGGVKNRIVSGNAYYLFPSGIRGSRQAGRVPPPARQRLVLLQQNFVSIFSLFHRELLDEVGGFDTSLARCEDWDLWLRAVYAGYHVRHQPKPLALYRWGNSSMSNSREAMYDAETDVLQRIASRHDLEPEEREYLSRRLQQGPPRAIARAGETALRKGSYREAAARLAQAAALCPSEAMLVRKARFMKAAPTVVGPLLRRRLQRIETAMGIDESYLK